MRTKNILKVLCFFFLSAVTPFSGQTTVPGGQVYGTWTLAGSPYQVQGTLQIPNDSTLIIQPGVTVEFQGHYKIIVAGRLLAIGTVTDSITFTAANTTSGWYGIRFSLTAATNDTSKIMYCKVLYGKANAASGDDSQGGGIFFKTVSKAIVSNSRISNCFSVGAGGGISCITSSNPVIRYNKISENQGTYQGGGISTSFSAPQIYNNIICGNVTGSSNCCGGGIQVGYGNPVITGNLISNNSSLRGGGIFCNNGTSPVITNNIIVNNTATYATEGGGGICCYNSTPTITNNTIANNTAVYGGGVTCYSTANPVMRNNIIWGNTASTAGPQIFLEDDPSDPSIYYSNVQNGMGGIDVNGNFYSGTYSNNINSDPLFVSPSGGAGTGFNGVTANWTLQNTSPCIDTGDPSTLSPSTDAAGNPRVNICRIDMGAYEYQTGTPFAVAVSQTAFIPCNGYLTASLVAVGSGSGAPYTYSWNPGSSTNDTLANIGAGTYTITATNSSGCVRTNTFTVAQPAGMTLTTSQTNISCNGNCTGSATVTVTGGTSPYHYSWSSAVNDTLASTPANLCSGPYTVTVTDNQGCTKPKSITISTPSSLTFSTSITDVSCFNGNDGKITVTSSGGVAPIRYSIDAGISYQFSNIFSGLTAGTYSVIAKDNNGCQASQSVVVIAEPQILSLSTSQVNTSCYGSTNGSATVIASGGTPNYSYSWNSTPVQTTATASNIGTGNYAVTVTDQNGCSRTTIVNIISSLALPQICQVTVDSTSTNNIIYWDKTGLDSSAVIYVYRDTANNNYALIGQVAFDSLSLFVDTVRTLYSANGNPNVTSWRYKIAASDSCGTISAKSPFHQTMFIQNSVGNFSWNHYQIEGQITPVPALSNYRFKRDDLSNGNWNTIQLLSASSFAYTDTSYATYAPTASWRVETQWNVLCSPSYKTAPAATMNTVSKSRSNIKNNQVSNGVHSLSEKDFVMMPNPANSIVTIRFMKEIKNTDVEIFDLMGRKVISEKNNVSGNIVSVNTTNLSNGVYTVQLICGSEKFVKKLVIEK